MKSVARRACAEIIPHVDSLGAWLRRLLAIAAGGEHDNVDASARGPRTASEVWTPRGLTTYYVLFLIELKTRRVHVAGITTNPDGAFMAQVARNLTDAVDGFLKGQRFVICDRDSCFTAQFRSILEDAGVKLVRTPRQAPNCNSYAERFVLSIKSECLGRMTLFGESSLRRAVAEYLAHYHAERAHQGLGNERIEGGVVAADGEVRCHERLGGILKSYSRAA